LGFFLSGVFSGVLDLFLVFDGVLDFLFLFLIGFAYTSDDSF